MAMRGSRGTQLMAKNATIGSWPSISSCQRWAAAPSSPSLDTPIPNANARNRITRAATDITIGTSAVGRVMTYRRVNCSVIPDNSLHLAR